MSLPVDNLCACIDIGTNSVKLIIARLTATEAVSVYELSSTTRLGEGLSSSANSRQLMESAMCRTIDTLTQFRAALDQYQVTSIACVGTAALRDAENSGHFVNRAKLKTDLDIEVISGEEEARLSFLAVRLDPNWRTASDLWVVDVGGGSTELIHGVPGTTSIESRVSVNLGAVKLTERFLRSEPPTLQQLEDANRAAQFAFSAVASGHDIPHSGVVVGVGGTLTTLSAMVIGGFKDPARIHGYRLTADDLEVQISRLASATIAQRQTFEGLDPARADIILGGAIVLSHGLASFGATSISASTRGLRWGVLYDRFLNSSVTSRTL